MKSKISIITLLLTVFLLFPFFIFSQSENPENTPPAEQPISPETSAVITPSEPATTSTIAPPEPPVIIKEFEGLLDNVKDKTSIEQDIGYNTILKYVSKLYADEISNKVDPNIGYKELMASPEKYRGKFVRFKGVLMYLNPYRLRTNPAGVEIYFAGMAGNPTTEEFFWFHTIDRPDEPLKNITDNRYMSDEVEIEGAFLKIASYEIDAKYGGGTRYAPFIIGRKISKIVAPPPKAAQTFQWLIALIVGVLLIIIFVYTTITAHKEKKITMASLIKSKSHPPDTSKKDASGEKH